MRYLNVARRPFTDDVLARDGLGRHVDSRARCLKVIRLRMKPNVENKHTSVAGTSFNIYPSAGGYDKTKTRKQKTKNSPTTMISIVERKGERHREV